MAAFFITGTDTGVGKTFFGASLAAALKFSGFAVGVFKPIESGCERGAGGLIPADATLLLEASGSGQSLDEACPYRLQAPLAPSEAARAEGVSIDRRQIVNAFRKIRTRFDVTIVEGAGGILSPLHEHWTVLDLICELAIPVINVVGSRLGAINHTLLTERAILAEGVALVGHVINNLLGDSGDADLAVASNPAQIGAFASGPMLGILPKTEASWMAHEDFERVFELTSLAKFGLPRAEKP